MKPSMPSFLSVLETSKFGDTATAFLRLMLHGWLNPVWLGLLFLMPGFGGEVFGQNIMPPAMVAHASLPQNTNVWKSDAYTGTNYWDATQVVADVDSGIVGAVTIGTNIVPVSGSEQTATTADGLTEIIEQDDVLLTWNPNSSLLWSPDLVNWQLLYCFQEHAAATFPKTNAMFFKLP